MDDLPPPPPGVTLRDPADSASVRKDIEDSTLAAMQKYVNGYSYGGVKLELKDLKYAGPERFTEKQIQDALLNDRALTRRLRGTVRLVDEESNKVLDERKNLTLAQVPYLTDMGTFIHNGSNFAATMQSRLLPGSYTRRRDNGELETHFNSRPGTGPAIRVTLDPQTAQFRLKVGSSNLHAYSVYHDLGVSDEELERRWGPDVLAQNKAKYSRNTLDRLYKKAVPKWERDDKRPAEEKAKEIRAAFDRVQVATTIMQNNLPNLFSAEKAAAWRTQGIAVETMEKMIKEASEEFAPDFTPEQIYNTWESFDLPLEKRASFSPDFSPEEMKESYNSIYGNTGPQLASMREWPQHWLDDQDGMGWLQWYQNYSDGRRSDTDEKQMQRWKSFKARHGAQFVNNPTPKRAYSLTNWGIDPLKMLPEEEREEFAKEMEKYRSKEYVKWFMNRHDFDEDQARKLGLAVIERGMKPDLVPEIPGPGHLMAFAEAGLLKPEDMKL